MHAAGCKPASSGLYCVLLQPLQRSFWLLAQFLILSPRAALGFLYSSSVWVFGNARGVNARLPRIATQKRWTRQTGVTYLIRLFQPEGEKICGLAFGIGMCQDLPQKPDRHRSTQPRQHLVFNGHCMPKEVITYTGVGEKLVGFTFIADDRNYSKYLYWAKRRNDTEEATKRLKANDG